VRQPRVRHVAAVQVQVREARQRGDRLQPRVADACNIKLLGLVHIISGLKDAGPSSGA
jgi:hypothetical protein